MSSPIFPWINFVLLFGGLAFFAKKKLDAHFAEQKRKVQSDMEEAGAQHARIKQEHDELTQMIARSDSKIQEMAQISKTEIENEKVRIETETKRVIEKLAIDSETRIRAEGERAKQVLGKELFESALSQARESLKKDLKNHNTEWTSQFVQTENTSESGKKNYGS